jgi:hypothetical protein
MALSICRYTADQAQIWNQFLHESLNGVFLFHRNYMDYHKDRFQDHSLMAYEGKKLKAILPGNTSGTTYYSHQGLTYGGWVVAKRFSITKYQELFEGLETYLAGEGFKTIHYKCKPAYFSNHFSEADAWVMWNRGWQLTRRDASFGFNIQNPPGYARDKRYRSNKAQRNNLRIDWNGNPEVLMALVNKNLGGKYGAKAVHTHQEVALLQSKFKENIYTVLVYQEDIFLGGTWLFVDHDFVHTQYLHTNDMGKELCAVEFLVENLIEKFKHKRYFSFGTSTEDQGRKLNVGLADFKEGFGSATFLHDFYEIQL